MRYQDLCGICRALQCTTAGPHNAISCNILGGGSVCGLGPDLVGIHFVSLAARYRVAARSTTLYPGVEKIQAARGYNFGSNFALSLPTVRNNFLLLPWRVAQRTLSVLFPVWTVTASLMKHRRIRSVTSHLSRMLLDQSPSGPLKFCDQSVVHPVPHETCVACFSSCAHCRCSSNSLQLAMHGSKISH